jgi:hypothetical protein
MTKASDSRIGWLDLPRHVRLAVEATIGGAVVEAVSQPDGFSPATADRVRIADERRARGPLWHPPSRGPSGPIRGREAGSRSMVRHRPHFDSLATGRPVIWADSEKLLPALAFRPGPRPAAGHPALVRRALSSRIFRQWLKTAARPAITRWMVLTNRPDFVPILQTKSTR